MKALVIIDMQYGFRTAQHQGTINNCIRQIAKAIKAEMPIIVVEYENCNKTVKPIRQALRGYRYKYTVKKRTDNGSNEIMRLVKRKLWEIEKFIVCGVNIGACVADTVYGLTRKYDMEVDVIKNACNDRWQSKIETFNMYSDIFYINHNVSVL
jgi:nicotinamidase-related amidase